MIRSTKLTDVRFARLFILIVVVAAACALATGAEARTFALVSSIAFGGTAVALFVWGLLAAARLFGAAFAIRLAGGTIREIRLLGFVKAPGAGWTRVPPARRTNAWESFLLHDAPSPEAALAVHRASILGTIGGTTILALIAAILYATSVGGFRMAMTVIAILAVAIWALSILPFQMDDNKSDVVDLFTTRQPGAAGRAALALVGYAWLAGDRPRLWRGDHLLYATAHLPATEHWEALGFLESRASDLGDHEAAVQYAKDMLEQGPTYLFLYSRLSLAICRLEAGQDDAAEEVTSSAVNEPEPALEYLRALHATLRGAPADDLPRLLANYRATRPGYPFDLEEDRVARLLARPPVPED